MHVSTFKNQKLYIPKYSRSRHGTGFVQIIIIIVIIVLILSYFNVDLQGLIEQPLVQKNLQTAWGWALWIWDNILREPVRYIWSLTASMLFKEAAVQISG